jgi:hypothetical protein
MVPITILGGRAGLFAAAASILLVVSLAVLGYVLRDRARLRDAATVQTAQAARERRRTTRCAPRCCRAIACSPESRARCRCHDADDGWNEGAVRLHVLGPSGQHVDDVAHNMPELKPGGRISSGW